jgi:hypothetical protein
MLASSLLSSPSPALLQSSLGFTHYSILSLFRSIRRCGRSTLLHHGTGSHHTHTQSARNDTILL